MAVSLPESSELVPGVMSLTLIRAPSLGGLNRATSISCGNEYPAEVERREREREGRERERKREREAEGRGQRKSILEPVQREVVSIFWIINSNSLPQTASN